MSDRQCSQDTRWTILKRTYEASALHEPNDDQSDTDHMLDDQVSGKFSNLILSLYMCLNVYQMFFELVLIKAKLYKSSLIKT